PTQARPLLGEERRGHPLARENLAVRELGIVAYAGIPMRSASGEVLGSFWATDTVPRQWTADDVDTLKTLAASVSAELELRRGAAEQRAQRELSEQQRSLTLAL